MNESEMTDKEKIERFDILKEFSTINTANLCQWSEGQVAHYTGGFVDSGVLDYDRVLGFYKKIDIVRLREILDIVREELKHE